jgi:hypothetical protein
MLGNSDTYPLSVMAGHVPAIRSGTTSLRQMADWVAGRDEWVSMNERWDKAGGSARGANFCGRRVDIGGTGYLAANCVLPNITSRSASVIWPLRCFSASTATPRCTAGRAAITSCQRFTFG